MTDEQLRDMAFLAKVCAAACMHMPGDTGYDELDMETDDAADECVVIMHRCERAIAKAEGKE